MHRTLEYMLWSNCTGKCKFCLQYEKHDLDTILNEQEMISSIEETEQHILKNLNSGDDVLLVGGEILFPWYEEVNRKLVSLFNTCIDLIKDKKLRYLYINTNLVYTGKNRILLDSLLSLFVEEGLEDHLKFTTSYDVYGRFNNIAVRHLVEDNLLYIHNNYPTIRVVANTIITKQLVDAYIYNKMSPEVGYFNPTEFEKKYHLKYLNLLPYIPSCINREMDVSLKDIMSVLVKREKEKPGIIDFYIDDFDLNQDKHLHKYTKTHGLVSCTAEYSDCHHNSNFKKVLPSGECFICKLKEIFR